MRFRLKILAVLGMTLIFCVGWGEKTVDLLDSGKLIDLDRAIGYTMPGGEWDQGKNQQDTGEQETVNPEEPEEDSKEHETTDPGRLEVISIYVRDEQVYLFGGMVSLGGMEEKIRENINPSIKLEIVDDWAEAHTYRKVRDVLQKLKKEKVITKFTERTE